YGIQEHTIVIRIDQSQLGPGRFTVRQLAQSRATLLAAEKDVHAVQLNEGRDQGSGGGGGEGVSATEFLLELLVDPAYTASERIGEFEGTPQTPTIAFLIFLRPLDQQPSRFRHQDR